MSKIEMKTCTLWGDMSSDSAAEQYPQEPVCTACIEEEQAKGENSRIVSVGSEVKDRDAVCALCDSDI